MRAAETVLIACFLAVQALPTTVSSRESTAGRATAAAVPSANPAYCLAEHNVGRLVMSVSNNGTLGTNFAQGAAIDCFTGLAAQSCEYPKGSQTTYLFGAALWVGAVLVNHDTLVSVGADGWQIGCEMHPDEAPAGNVIHRSTSGWCEPENEGAISEQDFIGVYTDTFITGVGGLLPDVIDGRLHIPLRIEVTCASHAWSRPELEDFVLVDYTFRNIGSQRLTKMYVGFYVDGDVGATDNLPDGGFEDDVAGFLHKAAVTYLPPNCWSDSEVVNLAYICDNDGDFGEPIPARNVTGVRVLRTPSDSMDVSFNWWVSNANSPDLDWGPRFITHDRNFGTGGGTGTPEGDRNKYYVMRNREFDYDQVYTATISPSDPLWLTPPSALAANLADGFDARYLLSTGGFSLEPGESTKLTIAYVAGENLHVLPSNINNLPNNPETYLANLDFSDLVANARWAEWMFDAPGYDSDSDGYGVDFVLCDGDTVWVSVDGIPDFTGTNPPPVPVVRVTPLLEAIKVQWNGYLPETTLDLMSRQRDFEGFSVYLSPVENGLPSGFVKIASFDVEDFRKYVWNADMHDWRLERHRFMLDELLCLYAPQGCTDAQWHPLQCPRQRPYVMSEYPDSVFYFEQIGANACLFGHETPIMKSYPDAQLPPYASPADVPPDSVSFYLTPGGEFKYYEYELTVSSLLSSHEYLVSVTAFDYGAISSDYLPLETCPPANAVSATPLGKCCDEPMRGNLDNSPDGLVTMVDLTVMIDHLFISVTPPECPEAGNLDLSADGLMTMGDLTLMIDHLFITLDPLPPCP